MVLLRDSRSANDSALTADEILFTHGECGQVRRKPSSAFSPSGVSSNALVKTARGLVLAKNLRINDQIHTYDRGLQPLRWVGSSRIDCDAGAPLRLLTKDGRHTQVLLSASHLVLRHAPNADLVFGTDEFLCPAEALDGRGRFERAEAAKPVVIHLLFDQFHLVQVEDIWVESYVPDMARVKKVSPDVADAILEELPHLAYERGMANYVQSRMVLEEREVDRLFN